MVSLIEEESRINNNINHISRTSLSLFTLRFFAFVICIVFAQQRAFTRFFLQDFETVKFQLFHKPADRLYCLFCKLVPKSLTICTEEMESHSAVNVVRSQLAALAGAGGSHKDQADK